jgi:ABC-type nitrate/sulfonate/bicarbonate transport system substrate-binding protein
MPQSPNQVLRVGGVPEHFNYPWRLALEAGAFDDLGVIVDYHEVPEGTGEMTRALRDGELDLALVLTEGAVADVLRHDQNRLVKVYVRSPLTWGLHVAADSPWRHMEDLENQRVAISRYGSGSHLIAIVDAAARGWDTDKMDFVVVENLSGARRALAAGEADLFLWEKHMTQPLVDAGEFRRLGVREVPWPAFVVSVRRELLPASDDLLRAVLETVADTAHRFRSRPGAADAIARTYGLKPDQAGAWLETVVWEDSFEPPVDALQRAGQALRAQGVLEPDAFELDRLWHRL